MVWFVCSSNADQAAETGLSITDYIPERFTDFILTVDGSSSLSGTEQTHKIDREPSWKTTTIDNHD